MSKSRNLTRSAGWCLTMVLINLVFAELYFLNNGASWKFYASLAVALLALFGFWVSTQAMKEFDKEGNND